MWEYLETRDVPGRVMDMGLAKYPPDNDEAACNILGREGWELVNCSSGPNGRWWYFFKRPLIEKDEE